MSLLEPPAARRMEQPALSRPQPGLFQIPANNFDFLRLFFAVMVIFDHSFVIYSQEAKSYSHEPLFLATHGQEVFGHLAVSCFFAISGFLITHSFLRSRSILDYFKKRILRIYPGFIGATLFGIFVVMPLSLGHFPRIANMHFFLHTLRCCIMLRPFELVEWFEKASVPPLFASNPFPQHVNGSMWTIPYEFGCYILLGLVGLALLKRFRRAALFVSAAIFVLAYLASITWDMHTHPLAWPKSSLLYLNVLLGPAHPWPDFLEYFFAGSVCYFLFSRGIFRFDRLPAVILSLAALAILVLTARHPEGLNPVLPAPLHYHSWFLIFEPLCLPLILFTLAFAPWLPLHKFGRYGDFSYGTYLYAFPIQQLLVEYLQPKLNGLLLFLLAAPWAILCGVLSWHLIEKWFMRLKTRSAIPREAAAAHP